MPNAHNCETKTRRCNARENVAFPAGQGCAVAHKTGKGISLVPEVLKCSSLEVIENEVVRFGARSWAAANRARGKARAADGKPDGPSQESLQKLTSVTAHLSGAGIAGGGLPIYLTLCFRAAAFQLANCIRNGLCALFWNFLHTTKVPLGMSNSLIPHTKQYEHPCVPSVIR